MTGTNNFDVIIVGGSYSGLAAAMALGRALKTVLIIDDGKPCNRQTPQSHNFITHDGETPAAIAAVAKQQVTNYKTVQFFDGLVTNGREIQTGFEIQAASGEIFSATNLIFATGIKDIMPAIDGFAACWGISVLHCPYCHGFEVRKEKTGVIGNGEAAYDFARLISNWTSDLTVFTNGASLITAEQTIQLQKNNIEIVSKKIESFDQDNGHLRTIVFDDGTQTAVKVMYAPIPFEQQCKIPELLGCTLTEEGYLKVDALQETTVKGVYACGDNASRMRTLANAVGMGTTAGMVVSKKMILEDFLR